MATDPKRNIEVFKALLERGEDAIQLPLVWAVLTAIVKGTGDPEVVIRQLRGLGTEANASIGSRSASVVERLRGLNRFFVERAAFRGNRDSYNDPKNSYLDDVLVSREGIPLSLSLIFMELGNVSGLELDPIAFPGHFLVKERSKRILCDPFNGRVGLRQTDCLRILGQVFGREVVWDEGYLTACPKWKVVERILNNLKNSFQATEDRERLELVSTLLAILESIDLTDTTPLH